MTTMQQKLSNLIMELGAFKETYKAEIADVPVSDQGKANGSSCADDLDLALSCLEDAMFEINKAEEAEEEEHANSSRENSKDYQAEENATTDRDNN